MQMLKKLICNLYESGSAKAYHLLTYPDQILLFSSVTFEMPATTKIQVFFLLLFEGRFT